MTVDARRFADDRGSLIPEFGLAAPLLIFLVLGIFEFGMAWRNSTLLANTIRAGARVVGQMQDDPQADRAALEAYVGSAAALRRTTTQKVIIYLVNSSNPGGGVPAACRTASTAGSPPYGVNTGSLGSGVRCNVYTADQLTSSNLVDANFGCGSGDYDINFCPTSMRSKSLAGSGPTRVGFYVEAEYDLLTGLLPMGSVTISDKATYRIEPVAS